MKSVFLAVLSAVFVNLTSIAHADQNNFQPNRYLTINGLKIAAYESSGYRGPGVLLLHGNTSSAQSYQKILKSSFAQKYRVVAIDLPGYGKSDNASSYSVGMLASTVAAAAGQLGTDDGVLVGWSLGGDIALQAASLLPSAKGIFIFGTAPVGYTPTLPPPFLTPQESYVGDAVNFGFNPNLTAQQISAYVTAFFRPQYSPIPNFFFADGLRTDPMTRLAVYLAATGQDPTFQDEVVIAKNLNIPLAIVHAEHDAFVREAFLEAIAPELPTLWENKIIKVKHSGHAIHWEKPTHFTNLLKKFIKDL